MNKKLETEAEHYAHNYFEMHETNHYKALKQGYIAGATSKNVEKQKIEFAIEQLRILPNENCNMFFAVVKKIEELEQKLLKL